MVNDELDRELKCGCVASIREQKDKFWIHHLLKCCSIHNQDWYFGRLFGNIEILSLI